MRRLNKLTLRAERQPGRLAKSSSSVLPTLIALCGLMIGLIAAFLFAASQTYSGAYFREYGVSSFLFETTWHAAIYSGSIHIVWLVVPLVIALLLSVPVIFVLCVLMDHAEEVLPRSWVGRRTGDLLRKVMPTNVSIDAKLLPLLVFIAALALAIVYGVYLIAITPIERRAADRAKKEIALIRTANHATLVAAGMHKMRIEHRHGEKTVVDEGVSISCQANTVCVIRQPDKTVVVPVKSIVRMETIELGQRSGESSR